MVRKNMIKIAVSVCCMLLVCSCSDEAEELIQEVPYIEVSETELDMPISGRYYSLKATTKHQSKLGITSDSDWLILNTDSVAADGTFEFYVCENKEQLGRDAIIKVYDIIEPVQETIVKVHQQGPNESDSNDGNTAYHKFRMGYGYNIFKNYMDDNSKTLPILNTDNPTVQQMIQISLSNKEEVEHFTANTLEEMAEILTKNETKSSSSVFGNKNTSYRFEQSGTNSKDETWFSYIRLYRTSAYSALDMGKLHEQLDKSRNVLFTDDFKKVYDNLTDNKHVPTRQEIDNLLKTYGTHFIVVSELGGSMDLTLNFKRTMKGSLNIRAEDFADYLFNGENMEYNPDDICTNIQANTQGTSAFKIVGGSKSSREAIQNSINGKDKKINSKDLLAWQNSLNLSSIDKISSNEGVVAVNFQMVPIATLFPSYLQSHIQDGLLRMAEEATNNTLTDLTASTDKYRINLKNADFLKFSDSEDASLVKVFYVSNLSSGKMIPTLEICNEYVPVIRGDKRINVIYGIRNGRPFHGAGLFPGDGEGNPPAWLTFSGGQVYVNPIKNKSGSDKIEEVYYMHGNIYETDLGLNPPAPKRMKTENHYCNVFSIEDGKSWTDKIPCVKIGSGYWFRSNSTVDLRIVVHLDDMFDDGDAYEYSEIHPTTKKYYAGLYGDIHSEFLGYNSEYIGKERWFLPTPEHVNDLRTYMGNNTKAFFRGQVSGFNAEFDGYYGPYDLKTKKWLGNETFRDFNEVCCIACRTDWDQNGNSKGAVMLLWPDYKIELANKDFCSNNYFPVRLYRTSEFQYAPIDK